VLALSLAGGRARRVLTEERAIPFRDLGYRGFEKEESGVTTRELARLRAAKRTCGSMKLRFQQGIERADPAQRG
jgi:hypothetical protein